MMLFKDHEESPLMNVTPNQGTSEAPIPMREYKIGCKHFLFLFLFLFCVMTAAEVFFVVPPGTIGVVVTLGQIDAFTSGSHVKIPFVSELIFMTAKIQKLEEENDIPTKEGLIVRLDTAM